MISGGRLLVFAGFVTRFVSNFESYELVEVFVLVLQIGYNWIQLPTSSDWNFQFGNIKALEAAGGLLRNLPTMKRFAFRGLPSRNFRLESLALKSSNYKNVDLNFFLNQI